MKNVKKFLSKLPFIGKKIQRYHRKKNRYVFDKPTVWIERLLPNEPIQIVQIGSNDGMHGDPLRDLIKKNDQWNALFVEPIPYLFEKLKTNYGEETRFSFENSAINNGTEQIFYSVKEEAKNHVQNLPKWYDQLGSFKRENITKHLNGALEPYIIEMRLTGLTLDGLFQKHGIQKLQLLHIDTEGYDWNVLSQLDLKSYQPQIILFEHVHLTTEEKSNAINHLKSKYSIVQVGNDMICLKRDIYELKDLDLNGKKIA
ncbi:FkbM family methyltransferase [Psychroserpens sp. XS_ASV72]|uniref:FkbM family methyltransferase n=1 Tax=Psychroserpens sp. XS_ASV72 TaxID=3241293 RepID=UPI003511FF7A